MKHVKYMCWAAIFAAFPLAGCSHDKEEAGALIRLVELYRAAPDDQKEKPAADIKAFACTAQDVCDARDECQQMAEPTAAALKTRAEAHRIIDQAGSDAGANVEDLAGLPDRLDAASQLLDLGHEHLVPCQDKLTGLRVKYHL